MATIRRRVVRGPLPYPSIWMHMRRKGIIECHDLYLFNFMYPDNIPTKVVSPAILRVKETFRETPRSWIRWPVQTSLMHSRQSMLHPPSCFWNKWQVIIYIAYRSLVVNISCLKYAGTTGRKVFPTFTFMDLLNLTYLDKTCAREVSLSVKIALHNKLLSKLME